MRKPSEITAIVLCGGLGTRLHSITQDRIPKPMVSVADRPFLEYLLDYLISQGITQVVLAISHRKDVIIHHFGDHYRHLHIAYSIEETPLGTGGAIKQAINLHHNTDCSLSLILNGDTFVEYQLEDMLKNIAHHNADLIMALKPLEDTDRYGRVTVDQQNRILSFEEKSNHISGNINTGVYLLNTKMIESLNNDKKFSFEIDFLEKNIQNFNMYASYIDGYFIDIGIPTDYHKFQSKLIKNNSYA